jgi:MoxR-like ATPase
MPDFETPQTDTSSEQPDEEKREKFRELRGLERYKDLKESVVNQVSDILGKAEEILGEELDMKSEGYEQLKERIEELTKDIGGKEEVDEMKGKGFRHLRNFMEKRKELHAKQEELRNLRTQLLQEANQNRTLKSSTDFWEIANRFDKRMDSVDKELDELAHQDPESFVANEMLRLREYKHQLRESGIVETPYVKEKKEDIEETLLRNGTVALVGETGTGKTKIAEKIARNVTGKPPEWIFGHGMMSKEDLLYHLGISPEKQDAMDVPEMIEGAKEEFRNRHGEIDEDHEAEAMSQIEEVLKGQAQEKTMETEVEMGPVITAAQEGRTAIIDEFNYIQPQLLAGLNSLVEAEPGSEIEFMGQRVEVQEGFGIIFTGNITSSEFDRYQDREELDPAFVNRLNSGLVEYNTPPQDTKRNFQEVVPKEGEELGEVDKDLFLIGLTNLIDEKGNLKAKEDTLDEAWRLSRSFSLMQKIYAGESVREDIDALDVAGTEFNMKKYHASLRTFGDILEHLKQDNFEQDIEWHIYDSLLRPSSVVAPKETAQMFYILQSSYGGFFEGEPWDQIEVDTTSWTITGLDKIQEKIDEANIQEEADEKRYMPEELAKITSGEDLPEAREESAQMRESAAEQKEKAEIVMKYEKMIEEMEDKLENYEDTIKRFCEDEKEILGEDA